MKAAAIARALVHQVFQAKCLLMVPETYWTGHECDLLVVTQDLRVVDVEIKVSRSDFKRDAAKEKWWKRSSWVHVGPPAPDQPLLHPKRIWKSYFALPRDVWKPDMLELLPSPACGVLLFYERDGHTYWLCEKRAKPARDAEKIEAADALDVARLAGLRMWEALAKAERLAAREMSVAEAVGRAMAENA